MATGIGKKFNWVQRPSTWEYAQAWRNQRAQMAAKFLEQGTVAVNALCHRAVQQHGGLVANAQQAAITSLEGSAEEGVSVLRRESRRGV